MHPQTAGVPPPPPPPPAGYLSGSGKQRVDMNIRSAGAGLAREDCTLVESGLVRFYYRARLPPATAEPGSNAAVNPEEVPRLYLLLLPGATEDAAGFDEQCRTGRKRLLVVSQKAVAGTGIGSSLAKTACYVAAVSDDMEDISKALVLLHGGPAAQPCGEGSYVIVRLEGMTFLTYAIRPPCEPVPALQEDFIVNKSGSYLLAVKNPQFPSTTSNVRLPKSRFSRELQAHFGDNRRWAPLDDPTFLDYVGAELVMLGVSTRHDEEDLGEAGVELRSQLEQQRHSGLLSDVPALMSRLGKPLTNRNPIC
jgi:hypothetical protein